MAETSLTIIKGGYQYDLTKIPEKSAPLIQEASREILRDMRIDSIIQNLENVARLMFVAYNALGGTKVQSRMSGLEKKYLDLMDESEQAIITFKQKSEFICAKVAEAYKWMLKGKEQLALTQFNKCADAAAEMARQAEHLATGFQTLSDQAEVVLEHTQDEQSLQYQEIEKVKTQLGEYNAQLKKCESMSESLEKDVESINKVYEDARKKEQAAFDMKKSLVITQIVVSCIGAVIPSVSGVNNAGSSTGTGQAASEAQNSLDEKKEKKEELALQMEDAKLKQDDLAGKIQELDKEIESLEQSIEAKKAVTVADDPKLTAEIEELERQLAEKQKEREALEKERKEEEKKAKNAEGELSEVSKAIETLNKQLAAYAEQARGDLERAEAAAQEALKQKLELEKQRRETLASIQEFSALIESGVRRKNVAETAVQTLQVAIRCIKQVVVALTTAAKFWRSMEAYCRTLSDQGLGQQIVELSKELSFEERLDYYQDEDFMMAFLVYICRWAALYHVCDEYQTRNNTVREMVAENILSSGSREEEWELAGTLAEDLGESIRTQVEDSNKVIAELKA